MTGVDAPLTTSIQDRMNGNDMASLESAKPLLNWAILRNKMRNGD